MDTRRNKPVIALATVLIGLLLMGCSLLPNEQREENERGVVEARDEQMAEEKAEKTKNENPPEPGQVLPDGIVLLARINYGKSAATQCMAELTNPRNGWHDEVEFTNAAGSPLGSSMNGYHDYDFTANNFNWQTTNTENYDNPKDIEGEYTLTITANDGYSDTMTVYYDGGSFNPSLLSLSID